MAELVFHVVLCMCSEAELVARVSGIVSEHQERSREGIVPAVLAEDLVARLRIQGLVFAADLEDGA